MTTQASRAEDFINSIGINTHLDFAVTAYNNVTVVESALNYLGVRQVRDAMQFPTSPALFAASRSRRWHQIRSVPGARRRGPIFPRRCKA